MSDRKKLERGEIPKIGDFADVGGKGKSMTEESRKTLAEWAARCEKWGVKSGGAPQELTADEVRGRLKHIAGLCYGLACDFTNTELEAETLRESATRWEATARGMTVEELEAEREKEREKKQEEIRKDRYKRDRTQGGLTFNVIRESGEETTSLTIAEAKARLRQIAGLCYLLEFEVLSACMREGTA